MDRGSSGDAATHSGSSGQRAQSSPLGVVLVLAIVVAGSTLVVALGGEALSDTQSRLDIERAESSLTQFDSQAAMVALGRSDVQAVSVPGNRGYNVHNDSGWVTVEYKNFSTGSTVQIVDERSLGSMTTEYDGEVLAYQGGGVWRKADDGTVMVSPPEFHYRNATLTFPVVTMKGDPSIDGRAVVTKNRTVQYYPNTSMNSAFSNPLSGGRVNVTVRSEYYRGWGSYFETRTDGEVYYDHANEQVTATLVIPADYPPVRGGIVSSAPSGGFTVDNNAQLDSYNSSNGPYDGGPDDHPNEGNTQIIVAGDLDVDNNGIVHGDVRVGGDVDFDNNGELRDGNISYGGSVSPSDPHADGNWIVPNPSTSRYWMNSNASVDDIDSVGGLIDSQRDELSSSNDNTGEDTIDGADHIDCSANCRIEAGSYSLNSFDPPSSLVLDTSSGDVNIAVDGPMNVNNDVEIRGNGRVNVYAGGQANFANGVEVVNSDDNASQFWLYMNDDESVKLSNNVVFRGVVYGPGAGGGPGVDVKLKNNAHVLGGIVGSTDVQKPNAWIHYDEALADARPVQQDTNLPALTYLHISTNSINVTSG